MRPQTWNPTQFIERFSKLPDCPAKYRAYQSGQEFLTSDQRKLLREFEVARSFCDLLGLEARLVMLDPNSSYPPPPDIECQLPGGSHFLELAEIVQEDIAEAASAKENCVIWDSREPLAKVWQTLWGTLTKKLQKSYDPEARPRSLLLYYYTSDSFWELLHPVVDERTAEIRNAFVDSGTFDRMFLFDAKQQKLLLAFSGE